MAIRRNREEHFQDQINMAANFGPKNVLEAVIFTIIVLTVWPIQDLLSRHRRY